MLRLLHLSMGVLRPHGPLKLEEERPLRVELDSVKRPIHMLYRVEVVVDLEVERHQIHMVMEDGRLLLHTVVLEVGRLRHHTVVEEVEVERHQDGQLVVKHLLMEVMAAGLQDIQVQELEVEEHLDRVKLVLDHVHPIHTLDLRNHLDRLIPHPNLKLKVNNYLLARPILIPHLHLILPLLLSLLLLPLTLPLHLLRPLLPEVRLLHKVLLRHMVLLRLTELLHPTEPLLRLMVHLPPHHRPTHYHGIGQWISGIS
jgi:hypothetical protein